jgi:hypothetical protein
MKDSSSRETSALAVIAASDDVEKVRGIARNARGKSDLVERAAIRRIVVLESRGEPGTVEHDCWGMILAVEEIRRQVRGRKSPMNRLRPKIAREGETAALEYLALHESDGFREVLDYGVPELSAEAIVIRHGTPTFSAKAVAAARNRLQEAGYDPDRIAAT